jgi:crotonobetainyl-CoA:carnitine CoA-transferase CaiB-like acyl-CoA transferase
MPPQLDRARWPESRARIATVLLSRPRADWCARLEGTDVCFAPVLTMEEAPRHPHHVARGTYITVDGVVQPAPAPRFSRTKAAAPTPPCEPDASGVVAALDGWLDADEVAALRTAGTLPGG